MIRIFQIWILVSIAFVAVVSSQDLPKAVLIDEFGPLSCEDILSRANNLALKVLENPNSLAIVVVHIDRIATANQWLDLFSKKFRISRNRFKVSFRKAKNFGYTEFWYVPKRK